MQLKNNKSVIVNRMFSGDYLKIENNIGHETINLFKDDEGNYNIYLNKYGVASKEEIKEIKSKNLYVLNVQNYGEKLLKVINLSKVNFVFEHAKPYSYDYIEECKNYVSINNLKIDCEQEESKISMDICRYIMQDKENIYYGNTPLKKIFENNFLGKDGKNRECGSYVTFRANKIWYPKTTMFITESFKHSNVNKNIHYVGNLTNEMIEFFEENSDQNINSKQKRIISNSSLKFFANKIVSDTHKKDGVKQNDYDEIARKLSKLVENENLWISELNVSEENKLIQKINLESGIKNGRKIYILEVIKQTNNELVISNILKWFFEYRENGFSLFEYFIDFITNNNFDSEKEYIHNETKMTFFET